MIPYTYSALFVPWGETIQLVLTWERAVFPSTFLANLSVASDFNTTNAPSYSTPCMRQMINNMFHRRLSQLTLSLRCLPVLNASAFLTLKAECLSTIPISELCVNHFSMLLCSHPQSCLYHEIPTESANRHILSRTAPGRSHEDGHWCLDSGREVYIKLL